MSTSCPAEDWLTWKTPFSCVITASCGAVVNSAHRVCTNSATFASSTAVSICRSTPDCSNSFWFRYRRRRFPPESFSTSSSISFWLTQENPSSAAVVWTSWPSTRIEMVWFSISPIDFSIVWSASSRVIPERSNPPTWKPVGIVPANAVPVPTISSPITAAPHTPAIQFLFFIIYRTFTS